MKLSEFIKKLERTPAKIDFQETIKVIDDHYMFEETKFTNGEAINGAGQNSGSCKIFAFAKLQNLSKEQTLYCFGAYYQDVLDTPDGEDHQNIRNFMKTGWSGISFEKESLTTK